MGRLLTAETGGRRCVSSRVYLQHVEDNLRIKFFSKVKVAGNVNGYRFQKLFTYYDTAETGVVRPVLSYACVPMRLRHMLT